VLLDTLKASVLPQFFPANWLEEYPIVFLGFLSRVSIDYVVREGDGYTYVLTDDSSLGRPSLRPVRRQLYGS
jgi:hypothetical protein